MFRMKNIMFTFCILFSSVLTSAQTVDNESLYPEWYVGGNLGVSWLMAEGNDIFSNVPDSRFSLSENGGFMLRAEIGYNISPIWGVRSFIGYTRNHWPNVLYLDRPIVSFGSEYVTGDLMLNISNLVSGQNLVRTFDFLAFAGTGVLFRNKITENGAGYMSLIGRVGGQGNFMLNQFIDLKAIFDLNFVGDKYNDLKTGRRVDILPTFSLGIAYYL